MFRENLFNFFAYSGAQTKYHYLLQKCGLATAATPPDRSNKPSVTPFPPLSEPIPGLPTPIYSTAKEDNHTTEVTVLSNGLRVASENRFGQFCTIGGNLWKHAKIIHKK